MDFAGFAERVPHRVAREAGSARPVEDHLLASRQKVDRLRKRAHRLRRNHDRAMRVGVDDVVVAQQACRKCSRRTSSAAYAHAHGLARPAANDLEARSEHIDVAKGAIGYAAGHTECGMHGRLHLAPPGPQARTVVHVLDNGDRRHADPRYIMVPIFSRRDGSARRLLSPDYACPGKTNDRRQLGVDDYHRLDGKALGPSLGETISSPLQIVGVSQALSVSRSSAVKVYSVIAFPEDDEDQLRRASSAARYARL